MHIGEDDEKDYEDEEDLDQIQDDLPALRRGSGGGSYQDPDSDEDQQQFKDLYADDDDDLEENIVGS